jgi:hypothetical protein
MAPRLLVARSLLCLVMVLTACSRPPKDAVADAPHPLYLGQRPPGMVPERFATGLISTDAIELNAVFTPDGREFLFTRLIEGDDDRGYQGRLRPILHHSIVERGSWSAPRPLLLFPGEALSVAVDMSVSPDGQRLFFMGQHPHGQAPDLWVSRRVEGRWSTATPLPDPVNTPASEVYSTVVADGSLYFTSNRPASRGRSHLYRAQRLDEDRFGDPVNVGPPINGEFGTGDTFVAPDERYLILASGRAPSFGAGDLFVAFRGTDGRWRDPVNLGESINTAQGEYCPMVTPDGRYLFFSRRTPGPWSGATDGDVFWVDARVIERVRP